MSQAIISSGKADAKLPGDRIKFNQKTIKLENYWSSLGG